MAFLIALILIVLVQWFHLKLLRLELPEHHQRWLPWLLALLHGPLILFALLRAAGMNTHGVFPPLTWLARAGFYFQAFTVLHLLLAMLAEGLWRSFRRTEPVDEGPEDAEVPEDTSRRAFLRTAAVASTGAAAVVSFGGARQAYGSGDAAFEAGESSLERTLRRVHDAGVDVANLGERKQVLRVGRVAELKAGRLVDRYRTSTGCRVGLAANVNLPCLKTPGVAHRP